MIRRPADFILGIAAVGLSVAYLQLAGRIPDSLLSDAVGAAGVPRALGWAAGLIGALLCLRSVHFGQRAARASPPLPAVPAEQPHAGASKRPHLRALGLLAILFAYVLLAPWLGYALATGLLVASAAAYAGAPIGRNLLLVSALAALAFWVLFVHVFRIAMPVGAWLGGS